MTTESNPAAAAASSSGGEGVPAAVSAAEAAKEQGNLEYRNGRYLKAAAAYTQGLKAEPDNAVLYSNRSAALLQLSKTTKALSDAEEVIRLRPEWDKGYFRKAAVLEALERLDEALQCYQESLARNKENKQLGEKVRVLQKVVSKQSSKATTTAAAGDAA